MDPFWTPSLEDLKKYFTDEEWSKLTDYDKKNYTNIMENYNIMNDLDMSPEEPEFVKAWRIRNASIVRSSKKEVVEENVNANQKIGNITPPERDTKPSDISMQHSVPITADKQTGKKGKKRIICKSTTSEPKNKRGNTAQNSETEKEKGTRKKKLKAIAESRLFTEQEVSENAAPNPGTEKEKRTRIRNLKAIAGSGLFTEEEVSESVRLDNTVGALYEYCLSKLFQESCNIASTSTGIENEVNKKQSSNIDSILKYLSNIKSRRQILSEDHKHIYCKQCQRFYDFFCPSGHRIPIRSLPGNTGGTIAQYPEYLALGHSGISEAGIGVWSTAAIPKGIVWGPFKDTIIPELSDDERERWTVQGKLNYLLKDFSIIKRTWNTLINCARYEEERNVMWFKHNGQVYYRVCKKIPLATEILMFYTKDDIEKMGIDPKRLKNIKLEVAKEGIVATCSRCSMLYDNSTLLKAHSKICSHNIINKTSQDKCGTKHSSSAMPTEPIIDLIDHTHDLTPSKSLHHPCSNQVTHHTRANIPETARSKNLIKHKYCHKESIDESISEFHKHQQNLAKEKNYVSKNHKEGFTVPCNTYKRIHVVEKHNVCGASNKEFTNSLSLQNPINIDAGEKPYVFTQSNILKTHKRIHTGKKSYVCEACNKGFAQSSHLIYHKRIHTGEKPYVCEVCNERFRHSSSLKNHKRIHTGEKPYVCEFCNKGFAQSSHLIYHKRIHTGEKSYVCEVCNERFRHSNSLKNHKRIHTGEKPYVCEFCNKGFTESSNLKKHKRIHTGEKPYVCEVCNERFRHSNSLKKHKRIHTV